MLSVYDIRYDLRELLRTLFQNEGVCVVEVRWGWVPSPACDSEKIIRFCDDWSLWLSWTLFFISWS